MKFTLKQHGMSTFHDRELKKMVQGSKDFRNGDQLAPSVLDISDIDGVTKSAKLSEQRCMNSIVINWNKLQIKRIFLIIRTPSLKILKNWLLQKLSMKSLDPKFWFLIKKWIFWCLNISRNWTFWTVKIQF